MGLYNSYANNDAFGMPEYGYSQPQTDYMNAPMNYGSMTPPATGSLFSQLGGGASSMFSPDGMKGLGSIMGGVSGLYGMYLGKQQLDDQKANNSLYRRLANEQNQRRVGFENNTADAFGSKRNS